MKRLCAVLIFLCASCLADLPPIVDYIEAHLPLSGTLKSTERLVFVDIDDAYVHTLCKLLQEEGFEEPPYFGPGLVGAHITVIYPDEMQDLETIAESGETIRFAVKECQVVHPPNWQGIDQLCLVTVEAPELDLLREKYGLPPKEHPFHITIGIKRSQAANH